MPAPVDRRRLRPGVATTPARRDPAPPAVTSRRRPDPAPPAVTRADRGWAVGAPGPVMLAPSAVPDAPSGWLAAGSSTSCSSRHPQRGGVIVDSPLRTSRGGVVRCAICAD